MSLNYRERVIWAKSELSKGVDSLPDSTNSIITNGAKLKPYEGDTTSVDIDEPTLGASEEINTGAYVEITFATYLAGAGALGTVPVWGPLMRACKRTETIDPGVDVKYSPRTVGEESLTMYVNRGGIRHVVTGCQGDFSISMGKGNLPMINWTFKGLYLRPTMAPMTLEKTSFIRPVPFTKDNSSMTIHGYAAQVESFEFNQGNQVEYLNAPGIEDVSIVDKDPSGSLNIIAPALTTKDFFAAVESHNGVTLDAFQLVHGPALNRVTFDAPQVQLTTIGDGDSSGRLMAPMSAKFIHDLGDDDFIITVH